MKKTIVNLDFDGTIHSYLSGWCGPDCIPDPPIAGAIEALQGYLDDDDLIVCFHTSRFGDVDRTRDAVVAVRDWLHRYGIHRSLIKVRHHVGPEDDVEPGYLYLVVRKPAADVGLDDKVMTFRGRYPTPQQLKSFRGWKAAE